MRLKALTAVAATAILTFSFGSSASATSIADAGDGAFTIGNRTYLADGTVNVDIPAGTYSLSECASGQFCVWSQANYTGSFTYRTGDGSKLLGGTLGSFWNNRSTVAKLYTNTSSSSTCYENGVMKASVTSSYSSAEKVSLSSNANC